MTSDVLAGALVDEPVYGCACDSCRCHAAVERPDEVCGDCEIGLCDEPEFGGEG